MRDQMQTSSKQGFSLIEVLVAVTLLGVVMLSLAGGATLALSQMTKGRQDLAYSADVQQVADSLVGKGWNKVTAGSANIRGRAVRWTVSTLSANAQKVTVVVERRGQANTSIVYNDTLSLYLAQPRVQ